MTCPRCHPENREGRRFCAKCAAPLAIACLSCGFSNEPGEDFCGGCAAPLAPASRPIESRFAAPQSYTPKHLAEKIEDLSGTNESPNALRWSATLQPGRASRRSACAPLPTSSHTVQSASSASGRGEDLRSHSEPLRGNDPVQEKNPMA